VNSIHYGFIRQGIGQNGASTDPFGVCADWTPVARTRTTSVICACATSRRFQLVSGETYAAVRRELPVRTNFRNSNNNSFSEGRPTARSACGRRRQSGRTLIRVQTVSNSMTLSPIPDFAAMALVGSVSELDDLRTKQNGQF
jgi:hypothetical protein